MPRLYHLTAINLLPCQSGFRTDERIMDHPYFLYVHSGSGAYRIDSVTYSASEGDIFYCPPYERNTIFADTESPYCLSGIDFTCPYPETLSDIPPKMNLLRQPFLISCIREMVDEFRLGQVFSEDICDSILHTLVDRLKRDGMRGQIHTANIADEILAYISRNFAENITHEQLSAVFSYHKSSINRILLHTTNMTLKQYLTDIRMKHAMEYVRYSSRSNEEIARLCGYSGASFLIRQFRNRYGMTPGQVRKHLKSQFVPPDSPCLPSDPPEEKPR